MILVVGGIKGGSGKTTIATNLAQIRAWGYRVLLVDADDQGSSYDWSLQRDHMGYGIKSLKNSSVITTIKLTGKHIHTTLYKMKEDYDDIIVDTGGRDTVSQRSALCIADKFLIPFKPRSMDIWTIGSVRQMLNECVNYTLKSYAFINQADFKGSDNNDAFNVIQAAGDIECLPIFIGNRKSFCNASASGLGVHEVVPRDEKACNEIKSLYDAIYV